MFKLPNGKKIDEEKAMNGMEDNDFSKLYFLDIETGRVKIILDTFNKNKKLKLTKIDNKCYILIPKISPQQIHKWMCEYVDEFINREDPDFAKKVYPLLKGKIVTRKLIRLLEKSEEGWIHGWDQWRYDQVGELFQGWLFSLNVDIVDEFEGDDNCPLCQMMKKADQEDRSLTLKELRKGFADAKKSGAFVGGQFDDDKNKVN